MSTESDRELLELAAKAVGAKPDGQSHDGTLHFGRSRWNPLTDDGDALRLAANLRMQIDISIGAVLALPLKSTHSSIEHFTDDAMLATRRAIVRAAAEIGRVMP